jgi:hypothetical protein
MIHEIVRIEIPSYIRQIQLAASRKAKYYELVKGKLKGSKDLPKKYQTKDYGFRPVKVGSKTKTLLCDNVTKQPVIANPKSCGTPRIYIINSQDLYNQSLHPQTRRKIVTEIKDSFRPYLLRMEPVPQDYYPLRIIMEVHDLIQDPMIKNQAWDLDNRSHGLYSKCFQDLLKAEGKIIDDNIKYITGAPAALFCPVEKAEDRKLVFVICRDTRDIILNHEFYKQ